MGAMGLSKLYFLSDEHIQSADKLDGRYLVWAEDQKLCVGQTLYFPERNTRCSVRGVTLILGKKIEAEVTETGHKYFLDFDSSIGTIEESSYIEYALE